jgi:hypothetical protein
VMEWEVFLPEQYKVKDFGGDAIAVNFPRFDRLETFASLTPAINPGVVGGLTNSNGLMPNAMSGTVVDPQGAVISGARVKVTSLAQGSSQAATTDSAGRWVVAGVPSGDVRIEISSPGFQTASIRGTSHEAGRSEDYGPVKLYVGETSMSIEVTSAAPLIDTTQSSVTTTFGGSNDFSTNGLRGERDDKKTREKQQQQAQNQASSNVYNLQKKASGVLPVRIDVPRAGNSYHFARALVLDEETKLTFNYKSEVKIAKR